MFDPYHRVKVELSAGYGKRKVTPYLRYLRRYLLL